MRGMAEAEHFVFTVQSTFAALAFCNCSILQRCQMRTFLIAKSKGQCCGLRVTFKRAASTSYDFRHIRFDMIDSNWSVEL